MDGVRTVAGIFLLIGWVMLVVGAIAAFGMFSTLSVMMRGNTGAGSMMASLTPLVVMVLASLSPFFLWAVLRALIAIHAELRRGHVMLRSMRDIEYSHYVTLQEATGVFDGFERAARRPHPSDVRPVNGDTEATAATGRSTKPAPSVEFAEQYPRLAEAVSSLVPTGDVGRTRECQNCGRRNGEQRRTCKACHSAL